MNGALLINKHAGVSSFGIIELLKQLAMKKYGCKHRQLPPELQKMGHGGTLDPFATGLLIVCVGRAVKLSRYFLGSDKGYEATLRFGETTVPGDPTAEISERCEIVPESLAQIQDCADQFASNPYYQTPPMHSAKKKNGKPLYELAREGIEVEREPKLCSLGQFRFSNYEKPEARFSVTCSSGTYIRTLAQDFSRGLRSVGMLTELHRTRSGSFSVDRAMTVDQISAAILGGKDWDALSCFVSFDQLLKAYPEVHATDDEARDLSQGKQSVLPNLFCRANADASEIIVVYSRSKLFAVLRRAGMGWELERVFP